MSDAFGTNPILEYEYAQYADLGAAYRPYDARYADVARRVAGLIVERMPDARVEHIGSSAVPGCAGKGIVDLMVLYSPGRLAEARNAVDSLGFQRQSNRDPFPEERPLRVGTIEHDGELFRLHVHVIAADAEEVTEQVRFRETLRSDPALVEEYVAIKRAVLAAGVADNVEYNRGKEAFIHRVIGRA